MLEGVDVLKKCVHGMKAETSFIYGPLWILGYLTVMLSPGLICTADFCVYLFLSYYGKTKFSFWFIDVCVCVSAQICF